METMENRVASRFMKAAELAEYIGSTTKFVEKHSANGRMPGVCKVGRLNRYDREVIDRRMLGGELLLNPENVLIPPRRRGRPSKITL